MTKQVKSYRAYKVTFLSNAGRKSWFQPSRKFGTDPKKAMTFDLDTADTLAARLAQNTPDLLSQGALVVEPVKPQPSYRNSVDWIANMDEGASMDPEFMSTVPTVLLVAEIFGMTDLQVAEDVVALRRRLAKRKAS